MISIYILIAFSLVVSSLLLCCLLCSVPFVLFFGVVEHMVASVVNNSNLFVQLSAPIHIHARTHTHTHTGFGYIQKVYVQHS